METKRRKRRITECDDKWTESEMMSFLCAVQRYGSADTKRIAESISTKTEECVKSLIERETAKARNRKFRDTLERPGDLRKLRPSKHRGRYWPSTRKWAVQAQQQVAPSLRLQDYSCTFMPELCRAFAESCGAPVCDEALDLAAVYTWMGHVMQGQLPPHLPPKESGLVLMLLRLLKETYEDMDLREEVEFLRKFQRATNFIPFQEKDEFRKRAFDGSREAGVRVPLPLYEDLSRFRRLVHSANPLSVPAWLLEQEQDFLANMYTER